MDKILEELRSRLGIDHLTLAYIKEAVHYTFSWLNSCGGLVSFTKYRVFDRLEEDFKLRRDPIPKLLRLQNCNHPQIVVGEDLKGNLRVLFLGLSAIEGRDIISNKDITAFTITAKEFLVLDNEAVDWETVTVLYLRKFFLRIISVVVVIDPESTVTRESRLQRVREAVENTEANPDLDRLYFLVQNVVGCEAKIPFVSQFCSLGNDLENDRGLFLSNEEWEHTDHIISKELKRNNFPVDNLDDAVTKDRRFNFLTFDFTEHLKSGWSVRWIPEEVSLSLFLNPEFENTFFYCRHPALVHWGPYLEEIVGRDILERFNTSFKKVTVRPRVTAGHLLRSFSCQQPIFDQSGDYNSIQLLFPSSNEIIFRVGLHHLFKWGDPFPASLAKISNEYEVFTEIVRALDIQRACELYDFKVTSSLKRLLLKGRLALLEQIHLRRCASCRVLGVDLKRPTGALSIFCVGATEVDSYPLAVLTYEESKDFILFYKYVRGLSCFPFQTKVWKQLRDKLVREKNKAVKKAEQERLSELEAIEEQRLLLEGVIPIENGGTRSSKRLKSGASSKGVPK